MGGVQQDFFKFTGNLNQLRLILESSRLFFHSSTNQWATCIYYGGIEYPSKQEMYDAVKVSDVFYLDLFSIAHENMYDFPDEDICLFKYFPMRKPLYVTIGECGDLLCGRVTRYNMFNSTERYVRSSALEFFFQNNPVLDNKISRP